MEHNLEWYRVFYWTAKLGGLTNAAKRLNITQPAVSHTLKQLESNLDVHLFFRTSKGVTLTSEGEVLFTFIEKAIQLIELGEKSISGMKNLLNGEISIGASDTLCKYYLLPFLEKFHSQYPDIKVHVTNRTTPETLALLKDGKIDFGVVNLPAEDPKITFHKSAIQQECLVGSPKYASRIKKTLHLSELSQFPLLLLEPGGSTRSFIDNYSLANGVLLNPEFELGSVDLLVQFALSGFGLTIIAKNYVVEELMMGGLIEIPLIPKIPERHIGIATLNGFPLSAAARHFLNYIIPESPL
ncbi:LysR family transcriptional regulator [Cohnella sp. GCM10020058]|uniref:LysR family transcriptional regulator n=1 Tax=Cohnella sp. GCM10020058 TaxID=3317330 RepID=UPI00363E8E3A